MTKEEAKEFYPILQAFIDGKEIEVYSPSKDTWIGIRNKDEIYLGNKYRIKPEPKYRPFKDKKECWAEMLKHQPFGWLTSQNGEVSSLIISIDNEGLIIGDRNNGVMGFFTATDLFKIKFADGTPFGVKEEE